jgi:hypothetical protein
MKIGKELEGSIRRKRLHINMMNIQMVTRRGVSFLIYNRVSLKFYESKPKK